jgi:uncharacterized protein (TIGR00369 family)
MPELLVCPSAPPTDKTRSTCFACGPEHPTGLRLRFEFTDDGTALARWLPDEAWHGFQGVVHGGIVSTVLDEAMAKAVSSSAGEFPTAELRVRFRRPVQPGERYMIRGWIVENARRRILTEGAITDSAGEEYAHAWGTFLSLHSPSFQK